LGYFIFLYGFRYNSDIHTKYKFNKLFLSDTSGTSGKTLKFYRNEEWDSCNRAAMFRGYSWYNVDPWERNGYLWGYNFDRKEKIKTKIFDFLQNRFRMFSYDEKEILIFAKKLKYARYIAGYSSMIYEIAKIINKYKISNNYNLKMIKGTSEKIYDSYQNEIIKAFGKKMINEYGAAESGLIAFECPEGTMHINIENVLIEEENNEIIVTNLLSKSFPIIRYKLGDYIKLAPEDYKCSCGIQHPAIIEVLGRVGKKIEGKNYSFPSLSLYYVFKNLSIKYDIILNYQAIQKEKGEVELRIEQKNNNYEEFLIKELKKYFNNDINFIISWDQKMHEGNQKLIDFISYIR
jgi:phenylacetate-CoA ligase